VGRNGSRRRTSLAALPLLACLAAYAGPAGAAIPLKLEGGWTASFDGFVNAFLVEELGDAQPAGVADDPFYKRDTDEAGFRFRTGFLPSAIGFTFGAPEWEGLKVKARVAFYPQINNGGGRTSINPNIDTREFNFTVEGSFGEVLVGRALNVFQQKNILSDMSLFGVGVPGGQLAQGPTLGHVGYGYLYPSFGAQVRYTTPQAAGLKLMVAIADPSSMGAADPTANATPTFEAEASWAMKSGAASFQAWLGGLYQQAKIVAATGSTTDVTATGGSAGLGAGFGGLDVVVSGFTGKGLGTTTQMDVDALDAANEERTTSGVLGQVTYTFFGKTKLGASYGLQMADETDRDALDRAAGSAHVEERQALTGGVYHDLTTWMKLVGEYTNAEITWFGGATQESDVFGAGMVVFW